MDDRNDVRHVPFFRTVIPGPLGEVSATVANSLPAGGRIVAFCHFTQWLTGELTARKAVRIEMGRLRTGSEST